MPSGRSAKSILSRVFIVLVVPYFLYLALVECPSYPVAPAGHNVVAHYICPPLKETVYPVWQDHVSPHVQALDKKFQITHSAAPVVASLRETWDLYDTKYLISYRISTHWAKFSSSSIFYLRDAFHVFSSHIAYYYARLLSHYQQSMHPMVVYYTGQYKYTLETTVDSVAKSLRLNLFLAVSYLKNEAHRLYLLHLSPSVSRARSYIAAKVSSVISESPTAKWLSRELQALYNLLLEKSVSINASLQAKTDFVKSEFSSNRGKFDSIKSKFKYNRKEIVTVVNHILQDVTDTQDVDTSTAGSVTGDSSASEIIESDEEDLTITLTRTLTATVTAHSTVQSHIDQSTAEVVIPQSEEVLTYGSDSSQAQVNEEIKYWESKVERTLKLATEGLVEDFEPILTEKLESLKAAISANLSSLQQGSFQRYKEMHELIVAIDKDSEQIRTSQQIIEEPEVDRQIMRDKIAAAYEIVEDMMKIIEGHLNEVHLELMTEYFKVAQNTVDVLESFADTTISDFSSRLTSLLNFLQNNSDYDDQISWSAWKKFHKVKESIFQIRDEIFDQANAYKINARKTKCPRGLEPWNEYLNSMNFHMSYVLRDNGDYLRLVRAKANVAYQQREGLTRELRKKASQEANEQQSVATNAGESQNSTEEISHDHTDKIPKAGINEVESGLNNSVHETPVDSSSVSEESDEVVSDATVVEIVGDDEVVVDTFDDEEVPGDSIEKEQDLVSRKEASEENEYVEEAGEKNEA